MIEGEIWLFWQNLPVFEACAGASSIVVGHSYERHAARERGEDAWRVFPPTLSHSPICIFWLQPDFFLDGLKVA